MASRLHPQLWARVKAQWHAGAKAGKPGVWNARKAQLAVLDYKRRSLQQFGDSGYAGPKPGPRRNSLAKWTAEDWGYASPGGRYLPRRVRESLTPAERRREAQLKRGRSGERVPYSPSVAEKMRNRGGP